MERVPLSEFCVTDTPRLSRETLPLLPDDQVASMIRVTNALSDPIRVQMIALLSRVSDLCTCEFEQVLSLPQSKVSYHLKQLLEAGLVTRQVEGAWSHYRLSNRDLWARFKQCFGA